MFLRAHAVHVGQRHGVLLGLALLQLIDLALRVLQLRPQLLSPLQSPLEVLLLDTILTSELLTMIKLAYQ